MSLKEKMYYKIKYLIIEFKNTVELDISYLHKYLEKHGNDISSTFDYNKVINEINTSENDIKTPESYFKKMYKNLAKKCHPDKKKNNDSEDFVEINKAYHNNDYLTLFIYIYENNIDFELEDYIIELLEYQIKKKEEEINTIKNKIHWQWYHSQNDLEKELIHQYIKSQL